MYRPEGWINPHISKYLQAHPGYTSSTPEVLAYEAGADAMLKALFDLAKQSPTGTFTIDSRVQNCFAIPDDKE